jgi:hypothetical protein
MSTLSDRAASTSATVNTVMRSNLWPRFQSNLAGVKRVWRQQKEYNKERTGINAFKGERSKRFTYVNRESRSLVTPSVYERRYLQGISPFRITRQHRVRSHSPGTKRRSMRSKRGSLRKAKGNWWAQNLE